MTWKSYAAASGAGLLATYLASYSTTVAPEPARERARVDVEESASAPDVAQEAARLEARMRTVAVYREPARNPFRFSGASVAPRAAASPAPIVAPPPPPPSPARELPFIVLAGIATDDVDGVAQRTAIVTTAAGVLLVRAGETVGSDYRVREVQEDGVVLESTADASIRILRLSTPPISRVDTQTSP